MPGADLFVIDLAVGSDGLLIAAIQRDGGSAPWWIAALDPATGEIVWLRHRDDLGLPEHDTSDVRAVAITSDRVVAVGRWFVDFDGDLLPQAFALELDHQGNLICHSTIDDYDAEAGVYERQLAPLDVVAAPDGAFVLAGYAAPWWNPMLDTELLLARFH